MVMMQSPISDVPQPASPTCNSNPCSPKMNSLNINATISDNTNKYHKFDPIRLERPQPTKFDGILLARFQEQHDDNYSIDIKNRSLLFPKDIADIETNGKFSIERLKQLTDHSINRLSPCDDSNQSSKYSVDQKYGDLSNLSPTKGCGGGGGAGEMDVSNLHHAALVNNSHQQQQQSLPFPIKYSTNPSQLDIERIKLARTISHGKELSNFGFRIQLGGLHTTSGYAGSDTSEELVVDGNDETLSQDTPTVCCCVD